VIALERLAGMIDWRRTGEDDGAPAKPAPNSLRALETIEDTKSSNRLLGRRIFFLLVVLVCLGAAGWMGARWLAGRRRAAAVVAPASSAAATSRGTDIGEDLKDVQKHADAGDAEAEYEVGVRYASGIDVIQDYSQAMRWFLQAADQGSARAQGRVATWMFLGRGTEQDYSKAYYWGLLAQAGGRRGKDGVVQRPYLSRCRLPRSRGRRRTGCMGIILGRRNSSSLSFQFRFQFLFPVELASRSAS
jgi:hypothetical protein